MFVFNKTLKADGGANERLLRIKWLVNCGIHHSNLVYLNQTFVTIGDG